MKRNITDTLDCEYRPEAALVVYKKYGHSDSEYYLETRPVRADGTLGAGRPVSREFIRNLAMSFRADGELSPRGTMPRNMLHADPRLGSERFVWWDPPGKRELFFLVLVTGKTLTVYAFKGARPSGKTPLLRGPFFNYYEDCRICVGSAKVDWPRDITWQTIIDHWEKVFWNSVNAHMISNPMKEGHNLVLSLKEAVNKPFDTGALRPAGLTLASII